MNMFELMKNAETIYNGVVEPYYKNLLKYMLTVLITEGK